MFPTIDKQGRLWVPVIPRPESDRGIIGDAMVELLPDDPQYEALLDWARENNCAPASGSAS